MRVSWSFQEEEAYLHRVHGALLFWAERARELALDQRQALVDWQAFMFDQLHGRRNEEAVQEAAIALQNITHLGALLGHDTRMAKKLARMALEPYFARLWFREGDGLAETVTIGHGAIMDTASSDCLVNDWRAPIARLYYDCTPGPAVFSAPAGEVRVDLLLKQLIRMDQGRLLAVHDADLAIMDDMLLDVLGRSADMHMRQVVATIQREQYEAIRDTDCDALVVTGPAGSGKTTVALHRVAFLLYRMRDTLKSESVRILSPTAAFCEAISHVLPDLGEEDMPILTLHDCAASRLLLPVEGALPGFERALARRVQDARRTPEFLQALHALAERLEREPQHPFADILFQEHMVASAREMSELYASDMAAVRPAQRLQRIRLRFAQKLDALEKMLSDQFLEKLKATIKPMYRASMARLKAMECLEPARLSLHRMTSLDLPVLYEQFAAERGVAVSGLAERRFAASEDAVPLLWLSLRLGVSRSEHAVRCLIVDEAQDLSALHLETLRLLYPNAKATFLGDPRQSIWPDETSGLALLAGHFHAQRVHTATLLRSYRNAAPISAFCRQFDDEGGSDDCGREGEAVRRLPADLPAQDVAAAFAAMLGGNNHTAALLTRTMAEAEAFSALLPQAALLREESLLPEGGLIIAPVFLAKGLEFDAVFVYWPGEQASAHARRMLYTACSRALHQLSVAL